jgi:hypothetical protein
LIASVGIVYRGVNIGTSEPPLAVLGEPPIPTKYAHFYPFFVAQMLRNLQ